MSRCVYIYDVSPIIISGSEGFSRNYNIDGFPTGGLYKLFSYITKDCRGKDLIYLCLDSPKNYRKEKFSYYKANRANKGTEVSRLKYRMQIEAIKKYLPEMGIDVLEIEGLEADDLIYSLAYKYKDDNIVIRSDDSDLSEIIAFAPKAKMFSVMGRGDVEMSTGTLRNKVIYGDTSDNIPSLGNYIKNFDTAKKIYGLINSSKLPNIDDEQLSMGLQIPIEVAKQLKDNYFLVMPKAAPVPTKDSDFTVINEDKMSDFFNIFRMKKFLKSYLSQEVNYFEPSIQKEYIKIVQRVPSAVRESFGSKVYKSNMKFTPPNVNEELKEGFFW